MSKPILQVEEHFLGYPTYVDARQIYTFPTTNTTIVPCNALTQCQVEPQEPQLIEKIRTRVKWTAKEDAILTKHCSSLKGDWKALSELLPGKSARQIEKRWTNKYDPKLRHRQWTPQEDDLILALYNQFGGKWIKIAQHISGRHSDAIKNRYYSVLRRRSDVPTPTKQPTANTSPAKPTKSNETVVNQLKTLVKQYETAISSLNERIETLESGMAQSSN